MRWWGRRPAAVALGGDLRMGKIERVRAAAAGFREKCGDTGKVAARWPYQRRSGGVDGLDG
jgi:hypothetical protein